MGYKVWVAADSHTEYFFRLESIAGKLEHGAGFKGKSCEVTFEFKEYHHHVFLITLSRV